MSLFRSIISTFGFESEYYTQVVQIGNSNGLKISREGIDFIIRENKEDASILYGNGSMEERVNKNEVCSWVVQLWKERMLWIKEIKK